MKSQLKRLSGLLLALAMSAALLCPGAWAANAEPALPDDSPISLSTMWSQYPNAEKKIVAAALKGQKEVDVSDCNLPTKDINELYTNVITTHPELFALSNQVSYKYNPATGKASALLLFYNNYPQNAQQEYEIALNAMFNRALPNGTAGMKQADIALNIHDTLVQELEYDTEAAERPELNRGFTAYDALVNKKAVCEGYMLSYMALLDKAGIESLPISSANHTWNEVKIDGKWYEVDVTWDDPTQDLVGRVSHKYFLESEGNFWDQSHHPDHIPEKPAVYPCTSTLYDKHWWDDNHSIFYHEGGYYYLHASYSKPTVSINLTRRDAVTDAISTVLTITEENPLNVALYYTNNGFPYSLSYTGGKFYMSTTKQVHEVDLNTKTTRCIYMAPSDVYLFGSCVEYGSISLEVAPSTKLFTTSSAMSELKHQTVPVSDTLSFGACTISLPDDTFAYTGKPLTPAPTIRNGSTVLKEGVNYKLTYTNNVKAGTATITATGIGNYVGTKSINFTIVKAANTVTAKNQTFTATAKARTFSIGASRLGTGKLTYGKPSDSKIKVTSAGVVTIPANYAGQFTIKVSVPETDAYQAASGTFTYVVNPSATAISSAKNSKKATMAVTWKKNATATGYELQYSLDKNFKTGVTSKTITKNSTVSGTYTKMTKGKTYYVRLRSYKTVSGGKLYSAWSTKSVKITK